MRPGGLSAALSSFFALTALALFFVTEAAGVNEMVIHNFIIYPHGAVPVGNLISDASGNLYGTAEVGGEHGYGAIFQLTRKPNGRWVETVLHSFEGGNDGLIPNGGLTFDTAGKLYGTTFFGGDQACADGCGLIFELAPTVGGKWRYSVAYRFKGKDDGEYPDGGVVFDVSGNLYGPTNSGLVNGTVFELVRSSTGWKAKTIVSFDAGSPGNLTIDADGALYGIAGGVVFQLKERQNGKWVLALLCGCSAIGGPAIDQAGNVYVESNTQVFELIRKQGWREIVIATFSGSEGYGAGGALSFDESGTLYGTTSSGGSSGPCFDEQGCGTVFKLTREKNGKWRHGVLYRFKGNRDGDDPAAGVFFGPGGNLYGTTRYGGDPGACSNGYCGTVFELASTRDGRWRHSVINRFGLGDSSGTFGLIGTSGLIADSSGNLYGTAPQGPSGCGMVYELTRSGNGGWKERILYQFKCGTQDGVRPLSSLIFDSVGNLYGTTSEGGTSCAPFGCGTVYELSPGSGAWTEKVLYSFTDNTDGSGPAGGVVFDAAGNLYGTTEYGGSENCQDIDGHFIGCGVAFELSPQSEGSWKETSLYTFLGGPSDGSFPAATLIFDEAGNLYGTTTEGGSGPCYDINFTPGCGTAFKLSPGAGSVWAESVLYNFPDGSSNSSVFAPGLVMGTQGNLYGATYRGGASTYCPYGCGTVYELSRGSNGHWNTKVLYNFGGSKTDGNFPMGTLTFDKSGNLYGTTWEGGGSPSCVYGCGTVFELSPSSGGSWTENLIYGFNGPYKDGATPETGVILDGAGNLYGTTSYGGVNNGLYTAGGTVFEISR